jgi:hypothetical protein
MDQQETHPITVIFIPNIFRIYLFQYFAADMSVGRKPNVSNKRDTKGIQTFRSIQSEEMLLMFYSYYFIQSILILRKSSVRPRLFVWKRVG